MRILLVFCTYLFAQSFAVAQLSILEIQSDGKKMHMALDRAKNYKLGDVINFYENRKLVTQGKISFLTPQKSKAVVTHFKGKPFQGNYMARAQYLNQSSSAVAQKPQTTPRQTQVTRQANNSGQRQSARSIPAEDVQRKPASLSPARSMPAPRFMSRGTTQDLLYYPEEDSFLITAEGSYGQIKTKLNSFPESTYNTVSFGPTLYYAPLQNLNIGLGVQYANETRKSGTTSDTASGLTDPNLYFSYQFLNPNEDALQLILSLMYSPSVGKSSNSTVVRGNHLVKLGTFIGLKNGSFSWNLFPNFSYYSTTKYDNTTDDEAYFMFTLEAEAQYDFSSRWAIYAPFVISYTGEQKDSAGSFTIDPIINYGLGLGFKHALSESTNLFFDGRYQVSPSITATTSTPSTHEGDQSSFLINLGMNFKF